MSEFINEIGPAFTHYDGVKIAKGLGEMSTEQAVTHWHSMKALLRKSTPVALSGASITVTQEGRLELAYGASLIYIEPEDMEVLQELATQAIRAREAYAPDASDSIRVYSTDASTVTANTPGVVVDNSRAPADKIPNHFMRPAPEVPRVAGKYDNMAHLLKMTEQMHSTKVKASQEASRPNFVRRGGFPW